jgi:hypothetical protein
MAESTTMLQDPRTRCLITLAVVAAIIFLLASGGNFPDHGNYYYRGQPAPFFRVVLAVHLPIALLLPLFIVVQYWVLTPVTICLTFSISAGLICCFVGIFETFMGGPQYGLDFITYFDLAFLFGWFWFSFFQMVVNSAYGFSTWLPSGYVMFGLSAVTGLWLFFPFGAFYTFWAIRALRRVQHNRQPLSMKPWFSGRTQPRPPGNSSTP